MTTKLDNKDYMYGWFDMDHISWAGPVIRLSASI